MDLDCDREDGAVHAGRHGFQILDLPVTVERLEHAPSVVRIDIERRGTSVGGQLLECETQERSHALVRSEKNPGIVSQRNRHGRRLEQLPVPFLGFSERPFGGFADRTLLPEAFQRVLNLGGTLPHPSFQTVPGELQFLVARLQFKGAFEHDDIQAVALEPELFFGQLPFANLFLQRSQHEQVQRRNREQNHQRRIREIVFPHRPVRKVRQKKHHPEFGQKNGQAQNSQPDQGRSPYRPGGRSCLDRPSFRGMAG